MLLMPQHIFYNRNHLYLNRQDRTGPSRRSCDGSSRRSGKNYLRTSPVSQCVEVELELDLDGVTRRQGRERAVFGAERLSELGQGRERQIGL